MSDPSSPTKTPAVDGSSSMFDNNKTDSHTVDALPGNGPGQHRHIEFLFRDVNVHIKGTHIVQNVSGYVNSGEVLAVMGPSGSGKTTLLNSLAGRTVVTSGDITLDGQSMSKKVRKRMCYVLQEDIFLSKLTLWETLYFAAMVYLPESITRVEKLSKIDHIIDVLDLNKCRDTVVGSQLIRGLSGGEKKRLSIACELIKDPDVMLMDEPTSGLDSSTAYSLMHLLKKFTRQSGKAVVVSIHQPSSQIFHMFTHLLLLAEGKIAYFGDGRKALSFFEELNLTCEPHYNPADFILETVKRDQETVKKITDLAEKKRCEALFACRSTDLWPAKLRHSGQTRSSHMTQGDPAPAHMDNQVHSDNVMLFTDSNGDVMLSLIDNDADKATTGGDEGTPNGVGAQADDADTRVLEPRRGSNPRWATGFWMQFKMLNWRTFKHSRSRIISKYNITNVAAMITFCSLLWFQMERSHSTIKDRMGYLFFLSVYWTFIPMFDAITSFPEERPVILKERAAGAYRLSAFYFAKMSSELPLTLLMPSVFVTVTYWMAGMRGPAHFMATWGIVLLQILNCQVTGTYIGPLWLGFSITRPLPQATWGIVLLQILNCQGIGYIIGAAIWDLQMCITTASIIVLYGLLAAGYYVSRLPSWLVWSRYLSVVSYPYNAVSLLELGDLAPLPCANITNFELPSCVAGSNATVIYPETILKHYGVDMPIYCYVCTIAIEVFLWRTIAYFALKFKKGDNQ